VVEGDSFLEVWVHAVSGKGPDPIPARLRAAGRDGQYGE
jgi:hypothetical protein